MVRKNLSLPPASLHYLYIEGLTEPQQQSKQRMKMKTTVKIWVLCTAVLTAAGASAQSVEMDLKSAAQIVPQAE